MAVTCLQYTPWNKADPYPLATAECMSYGWHGLCTAELCEYEGKACPWGGYPEGVAPVAPPPLRAEYQVGDDGEWE